MPVTGNPNRGKCEAELRKLGAAPAYKQIRALAEKYHADPATVWRWAKKIYPDMQRAGAKPPAQAAPASPQEAPQKASSAFKFEDKPVAEDKMPRFVTEAPGAPASEVASTPAASAAAPPVAALEVKPVVQVVAAMVNARLPERLPFVDAPEPPSPITDLEVDMLSEAIAPVVQKYAPMLTKYAIEINCAAVVGVVVLPRVFAGIAYSKYVNAKNKEMASAKAQSPRASEPAPGPVPQPSPTDGPTMLDLTREEDYTQLGANMVRKIHGGN